jgi:hypothetical protein
MSAGDAAAGLEGRQARAHVVTGGQPDRDLAVGEISRFFIGATYSRGLSLRGRKSRWGFPCHT